MQGEFKLGGSAHLPWPVNVSSGPFLRRGTFDYGKIFFLVMQMSRKVGDRKIRNKKNRKPRFSLIFTVMQRRQGWQFFLPEKR